VATIPARCRATWQSIERVTISRATSFVMGHIGSVDACSVAENLTASTN
jgi:hypothetical protein